MDYEIIQPPFTLKFREMPKPDLRAYNHWFFGVMPGRITGLEEEVRRSPAQAQWRADFTPDSLETLGQWFEGQVEVRTKTEQETEDLKAKLTFPIDVAGEQLTNRTFSLAMDIGMYFGQVILKNLSGTKWDQPLRNDKFADYGQPVIMGFGSVPLNPVRIVVTTAYSVARKKPAQLRGLYDIWVKMRRG